MAGLVPAIHALTTATLLRTWMPGTSPGMTRIVINSAKTRFASQARFALLPGHDDVCLSRHCEEQSDEAIHSSFAALWIASLRSQ
ncbi:MAG: hypothetical protein E6G79_24710 [Alphaproteobacteria bacterium]|nr:MAG: hypothetical protein E6G79_24710 [Alphaproteobacteria bacterium]